MSGSEEREYTVFHEDGPIRLTETELLNAYMRLRGTVRALLAVYHDDHDWAQFARQELASVVESEGADK